MTTESNQDTIAALKAEADALGITYGNATKEDTLRAKIAAVRSGQAIEQEPTEQEVPAKRAPSNPKAKLRAEANKLVRIQVVCANPEKSSWQGEVISAGNRIVGMHKKFVLFGTDNDGWHVPHVIYEALKAKTFMHIYTVRDQRTGKTRQATKMMPEFAITVMEPLSEEGLADLRAHQAANHSID